MDRPRVVSVTSKAIEERAPPDEAGEQVLESYVPAGQQAASQFAGAKPPLAQSQENEVPAVPPKQKGVLGSIVEKISSFFRR